MRTAQLSRERREAFGYQARQELEIPLPITGESSRACRTFAALANATRRGILRHLTDGAASAYTIAKHFELGLPSIYKHIRVLRGAGLLIEEMRGREKWYAIDRPALDRARVSIGILIGERD